jgi:hypothetical protein
LLVLPVGWLALLGNIGILFYFVKWDALQMVAIVPLVAYLTTVAPVLWQQIKSARLMKSRETLTP